MPVIRACFKVLTYNIISIYIYIYINIKGTDQKKSTIQISVRFFMFKKIVSMRCHTICHVVTVLF